MEDITNLTSTELLNIINKKKKKHNEIKAKILVLLDNYDKIKENINILTSELEENENEYVKLIELLTIKQNNE